VSAGCPLETSPTGLLELAACLSFALQTAVYHCNRIGISAFRNPLQAGVSFILAPVRPSAGLPVDLAAGRYLAGWPVLETALQLAQVELCILGVKRSAVKLDELVGAVIGLQVGGRFRG
jgi:hypothetical protein